MCRRTTLLTSLYASHGRCSQHRKPLLIISNALYNSNWNKYSGFRIKAPSRIYILKKGSGIRKAVKAYYFRTCRQTFADMTFGGGVRPTPLAGLSAKIRCFYAFPNQGRTIPFPHGGGGLGHDLLAEIFKAPPEPP